MLTGRLHFVEIHHVDETHLEIGQVLAQDGGSCQCFLGRHVAAGRHHDIRLYALVATGLWPNANALGAMQDRLVDIAKLQMFLLVGHDDVDAVGRTQALIRHSQQSVGVGWQVDARHRRLPREHGVDEPRALVTEPVVVVPPAGGGEEDVQRRDGLPPLQLE